MKVEAETRVLWPPPRDTKACHQGAREAGIGKEESPLQPYPEYEEHTFLTREERQQILSEPSAGKAT